MNERLEKFLKVFAFTLAAGGLVGVLWSYSLWTTYYHTLPIRPDMAAGRVYPDANFHGLVLYETSAEHSRLWTTWYSSLAIGAAGIAMGSFVSWWGARRARMRSAQHEE